MAAKPTSSKTMYTTLGAPSGALGASNGDQSGCESRMSTLTTPRNGSVMVASLLLAGTPGAVSRLKPSQASPNQDDSRRQGRDALGHPCPRGGDICQRLFG